MRAIAFAFVMGAVMSSAAGQTLTPMKADIVTFTDAVSVKVFVSNPYPEARHFAISVLDSAWQPVPGARVSRPMLLLASGGSSPLFVQTPVVGDIADGFYVCATTTSLRRGAAGLQGRVCGKYRAVQRTL